MVSFIDRLNGVVDSACMGLIDGGVSIKKGVMAVCEEGSWAMHDIYSLNGFEKWSKAMIANLRLLSLLPCMKGVFDDCIKTLQVQKDLIYATLIIGSMADFIKKDGSGFKLPRYKNGDIDPVKILYGIGNIFETGGFFQKYKVMAFPLCEKLAAQIGQKHVFTMGGQEWIFNDIPVLNTLTDKPKDFFVFWASLYVAYMCVRDPNFFMDEPDDSFWTVENVAKFAGAVGKMTLIAGAGILISRKYLVSLAIIDSATQNASVIGLIWKCHRERAERFDDPD